MDPHIHPTDKLTLWIQRGILLLVAVMPFHAFLSVSLGHFVGYQSAWQSWKEVVIVLLVGLTTALILKDPWRVQRFRDPIWYCFGGFVAVAMIITLWKFDSLTLALFGAKTDIEFLVVAAISFLVSSAIFLKRLIQTLLISAAGVIAFGCLQVFVLPKDWLSKFGYGPDTIQPYLTVDPAIDAIRIVSTLGGTNQLGSFLILPIAMVAWKLLSRPQWWHALYVVAALTVVWNTHGRATFLGLSAALLIVGLLRLPKRFKLPTFIIAVALALAVGQYVLSNIDRFGTLQYYVLHQSTTETGIEASTDQHLTALENGLDRVAENPLGLGLGSAGPASFRGDNPLITESYYLQIAIEVGILGLALFCAGLILVGVKLWRQASHPRHDKSGTYRLAAAACCAALAGISVVNLFLHGWADSSTALVYWSVAGAVLGSKS